MPRPPNPELPQLLLDAALELLDERGDASFSMRELASRVGYAVTAVYRAYESRGDILRALQLRLLRQLAREVGDAEGGPTVERIRRISRRYIHWALEHPARYLFMFHSSEPDALLRGEEKETAILGYRQFERLLGAGIERGEIAFPDASSLAAWLFSSLHGLASLALSGRLEGTDAEDVEAFFERSADQWLGALLRPPK